MSVKYNRREFVELAALQSGILLTNQATGQVTAPPRHSESVPTGDQSFPRQANWFAADRRKIHILYDSPEWAKDRGSAFNADAYAEALGRSGVAAVELYAKDIHGYTYFKCRTGRPYPKDVLGEMLRACHARGIKLIAYFSVGYDIHAAGVHPDWIQVGRDGQFQENVIARILCLNSPYADFALDQIDQLVAAYDVDGLWLDMVPTTWHEFGKVGWWWGELSPFCYCLYCRREYKRLYNRDLPMDPDLEESLAGYRMQLQATSSFLEKAKSRLRQYRPNAILTYNNSGSPNDPLAIGDVISIEAHAPAYFHQSMIVRWAKGQNRPAEILSPGAVSTWDGWDRKPLQMLQLEAAIAMAHGGGVTVGQQVYPRGSPEESDFRDFRALFDGVSKLEKYVRTPVGISDIGVCLSLKTKTLLAAPHLGVSALGETEGIHVALLRDQWQYDILRDLDNIKNYKLVIVGEHRALSDAELNGLRNYVRHGGKLLATGLTSLFDEQGSRRNNFALADVFGVTYANENRYPDFYVDQGPPGLIQESQAFRVLPDGAEIISYFQNPETTWTEGTTTLFGVPPPDPGQRYPLLTANRFGSGACVYIAASIGSAILNAVRRPQPRTDTPILDNPYAVRLLRKALHHLDIQPSVETTALGTEVVLNRHGRDCVLHVINHNSGGPLWVVDSPRGDLRGVQVAIRKTAVGDIISATEIVTSQPISIQQNDGWIRFELPPFQVSSSILLETRSAP